MKVQATIDPTLPAAPRSPYAPQLIAAYGLGATLWAPVLAMLGEYATRLLAALLGVAPFIDSLSLFVIAWAVRFAFYVAGANGGWNYGYGINGVVVNRGLSLPDKARRIATDWFGILLMLVWLWFMGSLLEASLME